MKAKYTIYVINELNPVCNLDMAQRGEEITFATHLEELQSFDEEELAYKAVKELTRQDEIDEQLVEMDCKKMGVKYIPTNPPLYTILKTYSYAE